MALQPFRLGQPFVAVGDVKAEGGDLIAGAKETGGTKVYGRHHYANVAGAYHWLDLDGTVYELAQFMVNTQPATKLEFKIGPVGAPHSITSFDIDVANGQLNAYRLAHFSHITIGDGRPGGAALPIGTKVRSIVSGNWTFTGWIMISDSPGIRVEVRKKSLATFAGTVTDSITGTSNGTGGCPRIASGTKNNSNNISAWTDPDADDTDIIEAEVIANSTGCAYYSLALLGTQVHV